MRRGLQSWRDAEDVAAVGQSGGIVAKLAHGLEDELEAVLQLILVGCVE